MGTLLAAFSPEDFEYVNMQEAYTILTNGLFGVLTIIFSVVGALAVAYAIFLGVMLAKAESESKRKEAKSRIGKTLAGLFIIVILMTVFVGEFVGGLFFGTRDRSYVAAYTITLGGETKHAIWEGQQFKLGWTKVKNEVADPVRVLFYEGVVFEEHPNYEASGYNLITTVKGGDAGESIDITAFFLNSDDKVLDIVVHSIYVAEEPAAPPPPPGSTESNIVEYTVKQSGATTSTVMPSSVDVVNVQSVSTSTLAVPILTISGSALSWTHVPSNAGYLIQVENLRKVWTNTLTARADETSTNVTNLKLNEGTHKLKVVALAPSQSNVIVIPTPKPPDNYKGTASGDTWSIHTPTPGTGGTPIGNLRWFFNDTQYNNAFNGHIGATRTGNSLGATYHGGIDIFNPAGTAVYAIADGVTTKSRNANDRSISINHGSINIPSLGGSFNIWVLYTHVDVDSKFYASGTKVKKGDLIARLAPYGKKTDYTSPHLHAEVSFAGTSVFNVVSGSYRLKKMWSSAPTLRDYEQKTGLMHPLRLFRSEVTFWSVRNRAKLPV